MFAFHRATTIDDALRSLGSASADACLYAGGTDLMPRWSKGRGAKPKRIIDLKAVAELAGITRDGDRIVIGACTPLCTLERDPVIRAAAPVLAEAAGHVACPQIRNRATLGGNLCNASPAADTAVPLILLDATLELAGLQDGALSRREVPIADFFTGPGKTVIAPGEILVRVCFKSRGDAWFAAWQKFGTRPAMEIAVASVGVAFRLDDGRVAEARVGYGSVAPTPLRGRAAEAELVGSVLDEAAIARCVEAARGEVNPISDVRASESYRREIVGVTLRRMLERATGG